MISVAICISFLAEVTLSAITLTWKDLGSSSLRQLYITQVNRICILVTLTIEVCFTRKVQRCFKGFKGNIIC